MSHILISTSVTQSKPNLWVVCSTKSEFTANVWLPYKDILYKLVQGAKPGAKSNAPTYLFLYLGFISYKSSLHLTCLSSNVCFKLLECRGIHNGIHLVVLIRLDDTSARSHNSWGRGDHFKSTASIKNTFLAPRNMTVMLHYLLTHTVCMYLVVLIR